MTDDAGRPRSRKGAATRGRLLDAARVVFRDGFLAARVSDIARQAGVSHGSFYHYFESKEQIFREIAREIERQLNDPLYTIVLDASSTAPPRERIRAANRGYLRRYRREAKLIGVIEQVARYDDELAAARADNQRRICATIAGTVRRLQDAGLADPTVDPGLTAFALTAMVTGFAEEWLVQKALDRPLDDGVEQLTTLFANAVGLRDAPRTAATAPGPA